jgi:transposase
MLKSYLGIDVHKRRCVYTELNATGKIIRRGSFSNNLEEVSDFASTLTGAEKIVVEPVLNYLWLLDQLEPYVSSVHVATPYKVRVIAESKCKTDRYDSRMLAELLRIDFLPESWIPPYEIRSLRNNIRQRQRLVRTATMYKNYIRHLLFLHGIHLKVSNIASMKARQEIPRLYLPEGIGQAVEQCLEVIAGIEPLVEVLNKEIQEGSAGIKAVDLLKTIPGIGPLWAATIYAEIGDINRFVRAKAFAGYTGLVPSVRSSGESAHYGGITYMGSRPLRTALVEAAIKAVRKSPSLNRRYHRILYRSNFQKAIVAVARKLAVIIYHMLTKEEPFVIR